jgi:uncharacterized protein YhfF
MAGQQATPDTSGTNIATIDDLMASAEELAQQIMTMESSQRTSFLRQLDKDNPPLHGQVKSALEKMENRAGQQGKVMARQGQM